MRKDKKLIPRLRFPEFKDDGKWKIRPIEEILDYERPDNYQVSSTNYKNEGTPVLTANKSFILGYTDEDFGIYKRLPAIIFDDFTVDNKFVHFPFKVKSSAIKILTPKGQDNLKFIHSVISQIKFSAPEHKRYYISEYQKLQLPIPSIKEQIKIADCLSSLDELIDTHNQKLGLLKQHKKGLMQNLFPQEREKIPRLRFKEFQNSGDWEIRILQDVADKKIKWSFVGGPFGSSLKTNDYTNQGVRIIQLQNIGDSIFNNAYKIYTSETKANELISNNIYGGDIILSKMGDPVGRACIVPEKLGRCVMASDGIRIAVDKEKFSKYFIFSLINSNRIRKSIEERSTGSTRKRIGLDELKKTPVLIPKSLKEQQKISSILFTVDNSITKQKEEIELLQQHKKGLMQGLFPLL